MGEGRELVWVVLTLVALLAGCTSEPEKPEPKPEGKPQDAQAPVRKPAPEADVEALATGGNAFALDLYSKLKGQTGNLFFSPYSISSALAMTYAGARGQTASQMAKALHFDLEPARLHPACASLMNDLNDAAKSGDADLNIANALWLQQGYEFVQAFLDLAQAHYAAGAKSVDFARAAEQARKTINEWVEQQTKGKIGELIPDGVLSDLTRLVLTNAIYFKGTWELEFKSEQTQDAPFALLGGGTANVPMMRQGPAKFRYAEGEGFQALDLAYKGKRLSMLVLLPTKADGLPDLEKSLTAEKLAGVVSALRGQEVAVSLPKFQITSSFALNNALKSLGMTDAFRGDAADFSGITQKETVYISAVLHKAFVDVNEKGSEAAAATAVAIQAKSMGFVFRADHPFLFLIRDSRSGAILFLGRVMNPKE